MILPAWAEYYSSCTAERLGLALICFYASLLTELRIPGKRGLRSRGIFSAKHYLAEKKISFCPILLCRLFIDILVTKIDFVLTTRLVQTLDIL